MCGKFQFVVQIAHKAVVHILICLLNLAIVDITIVEIPTLLEKFHVTDFELAK